MEFNQLTSKEEFPNIGQTTANKREESTELTNFLKCDMSDSEDVGNSEDPRNSATIGNINGILSGTSDPASGSDTEQSSGREQRRDDEEEDWDSEESYAYEEGLHTQDIPHEMFSSSLLPYTIHLVNCSNIHFGDKMKFYFPGGTQLSEVCLPPDSLPSGIEISVKDMLERGQKEIEQLRSLGDCLCKQYRSEVDSLPTLPWIKSRLRFLEDYVPEMLIQTDYPRSVVFVVKINNIFKCNQRNTPVKRILLIGDSGSGKSSVCDKLAYDWAEENAPEYLSIFSILLIIRPHERRTTSLEDFVVKSILSEFRKCEREMSEEEILSMLNKSSVNVLLLLDGIDEYFTDDEIAEFFKGSYGDRRAWLYRATILLTCRPLSVETLAPVSQRCLVIQGFNYHQITTYLEKYFVESKEKYFSFLSILRDARMEVIAKNSLMLNLLCLMHEKNCFKNISRDEYHVSNLYGMFVYLLMHSHLVGESDFYKREEVSEICKSALENLGRHCLRNEKPINGKDILRGYSEFNLLKSVGLLKEVPPSENNAKKDAKFEIVHISFLEYCIALVLSKLPDLEKIKLLRDLYDNRVVPQTNENATIKDFFKKHVNYPLFGLGSIMQIQTFLEGMERDEDDLHTFNKEFRKSFTNLVTERSCLATVEFGSNSIVGTASMTITLPEQVISKRKKERFFFTKENWSGNNTPKKGKPLLQQGRSEEISAGTSGSKSLPTVSDIRSQKAHTAYVGNKNEDGYEVRSSFSQLYRTKSNPVISKNEYSLVGKKLQRVDSMLERRLDINLDDELYNKVALGGHVSKLKDRNYIVLDVCLKWSSAFNCECKEFKHLCMAFKNANIKGQLYMNLSKCPCLNFSNIAALHCQIIVEIYKQDCTGDLVLELPKRLGPNELEEFIKTLKKCLTETKLPPGKSRRYFIVDGSRKNSYSF